MQTQSISKVLSTMQSNASGGAKKTGSADFSSYMSKNASHASAGERLAVRMWKVLKWGRLRRK